MTTSENFIAYIGPEGDVVWLQTYLEVRLNTDDKEGEAALERLSETGQPQPDEWGGVMRYATPEDRED